MNRSQFLAISISILIGGFVCNVAASAATIAAQDFNSLPDDGTANNDSVASGVQLTNAGSKNIGGPGLDFATTWFDTRGEGSGPVTGGESGDFIGVNSFAGAGAPDVGPGGTAVASGVEHNFQFNDGDGALVLNFESVDVSGYTNRTLSINWWINSTGYETDDAFTISLSNGGLGVVLLGYGETELEANASSDDGSDNWFTTTVDLDALLLSSGLDPTNLILSVSVDTNSSNENIFVDEIRFEGSALVSRVSVDVKPDSNANCRGSLPVAIRGSETLDVTQIDPSTLSFESLGVRVRGNGSPSCHVADTNGDGFSDLVCQFQDEAKNGSLSGELVDGTQIEGTGVYCFAH